MNYWFLKWKVFYHWQDSIFLESQLCSHFYGRLIFIDKTMFSNFRNHCVVFNVCKLLRFLLCFLYIQFVFILQCMFRNFLRSLWDLMYCIYTFLIKWPLTFSPSYHTQEQIFIIIISFKWCVQYLFIQHLLFVHAILYHHTVLILRLFSRFLLLSCSCTFFISSPKLKAQVSFSDHSLSVVKRGCCSRCCKFFIFSSSPEPLGQFQPDFVQSILNFLKWRTTPFSKGRK